MAKGISFNESQRGTNSPQDVDRFFIHEKLKSEKKKEKEKKGKKKRAESHDTLTKI